MADESVKVKVGADFSEAEKAAEKSGEKMSGLQKYFGDYITGLKDKLLKGLALESIISASVDAVKDAFKWSMEINDISERTGVSMEALQKLGSVGKKTGVNMETMGRMLAFANKSIGAAQIKAGEHRETLTRLGFTTDQVINKQVKAEMIFQALADSYSRGTDAATMQRDAQILLGRSSMQNLQMFKIGGMAMKNIMEQTSVFSDEQIRAMDRTARAYERAGNAWDRMKRKMAIAAMGGTESFTAELIEESLTKDTGFFGAIKAEEDPEVVKAKLLKQIGKKGYKADDLKDFIHAIEKAKTFFENEGGFFSGDEFTEEGKAAYRLASGRGISGMEKTASGKAYIAGDEKLDAMFITAMKEILAKMEPPIQEAIDDIPEGVAKGTSLQAVGGGDWIVSNTLSATERIANATEASQKELALINQKTSPNTNTNKTNIAK